MPKSASTKSAVQPDYAGWRAIRKGMTFAEVSALVGLPKPLPGRAKNKSRYTSYGWIRSPSTNVGPGCSPAYTFSILFDHERNVLFKKDPFAGVFSKSGKPTKPFILLPTENAKFGHFPRILDLRWTPSSGDYPMQYEIEIAWRQSDTLKQRADVFEVGETWTQISNDVHTVIVWVGANKGRFRVRGLNTKGTGPWTNYRNFKFSK